jgi:hypothetical protein
MLRQTYGKFHLQPISVQLQHSILLISISISNSMVFVFSFETHMQLKDDYIIY